MAVVISLVASLVLGASAYQDPAQDPAQVPPVQTPVEVPVVGPTVGSAVAPFNAEHVYGPLANRTRDFVTAYASDPQIIAWVTDDQSSAIPELARELQAQVRSRSEYRLRAMIVVLTRERLRAAPLVRQTGYGLGAKQVSFAIVEPSEAYLAQYRLLPETKLAIVTVRNNVVVANIPVTNTVVGNTVRATVPKVPIQQAVDIAVGLVVAPVAPTLTPPAGGTSGL